MPITVQCANCKKKYNVPETMAGKRGKCKACGTIFEVPVPQVEEDDFNVAAPDEPDLSALSAAADATGFGSAPESSSVSRTGVMTSSDAGSDDRDDERPVKGPDDFNFREPPKLLGPLDPYLPYVLMALGLGFPTFVSIKFAMGMDQPWLPLAGLGVLLLLSFLLVLPVSSLGLSAALKKLRVGWLPHSKRRLMGAISLPLGGVIIGHWLGGPQGMIAGALVGLIPGAVALAYLFSLTVTEAAIAVAGTAIAWVVATGVAVGFAYATGFAMNTVIASIEKPRPGADFKVTSAIPPKPIPVIPDPSTKPTKSATTIQPATDQAATAPSPTDVAVAPPVAPVVPETPVGPSARELSAQNLISIGQKLFTDAEQNGGKLAPDLATLATRTSLPATALDSPVGRASTGVDYRYLLAGVESQIPLPADMIVIYDFADAENTGGANVLTGEGRVKYVDATDLPDLLRKTRDMLPPPGALLIGVGKVQPDGTTAPSVPQSPTDIALTPVAPKELSTGTPAESRPAWITSIETLPVTTLVSDVLIPTLPSSYVAIVSRGEGDDETIERWNVVTREAGPKVTIKRDPNASTKYILSPAGDVFVRLVSWPKLSAQVWAFEGAKISRSIDFTLSATPTLISFVSPTQFAVLWEQGAQRGTELWDAKSGIRGKQTTVPDTTRDHGNFNPTGDGKQFGLALTVGQANQIQLFDIAGVRGLKKIPVTSVDSKWPLVTGGISISPDGTKVAALFEKDRDALLVVHRVSDGKVLSEIVCPQGIVPVDGREFIGSALHWLDEDGPWLVYGTVIDKDGVKVASISDNDRNARMQAVLGKDTAVVALLPQGSKMYDVAVMKFTSPKAGK